MAITMIKTEYIPTNKPNNFLKCELYYTTGGMNYFTCKNEQRGYYTSVSPVEKARGFETYTAFTGAKTLVKPCNRKSSKAEAEALAKYEETKNYIINNRFSDVLTKEGEEIK